MSFQISLNPKMTTPQKVALVPPRRGQKNGAQADLSSWMLFALITTTNSKWAFKLYGLTPCTPLVGLIQRIRMPSSFETEKNWKKITRV